MEIVGRLTADAKINTVKDGRQVVNFSVAVNDSYKPKGSDQPVKVTNYFNCSYWKTSAIAKHLIKGTLVEIYGRLGINAWTNAEGEAKANLNFHVNSIKLHGKPNASETPIIRVEGMENRTALSNADEIKEPLEDLPF